MTALLDPRVAELVRDGGLRVGEHEGGFTISTSDVRKVVTDVEGTLSVEAVERGASNGFDLLTEDHDVLQRYLVTWVLNRWRSAHGLGFLSTAGTREAPGYVLAAARDRDGAPVWAKARRWLRR
ncbi:hypothetical protein [Cellulomonas sp. HZM]|uniref:hypothetical protein n=1 Tax=Cellulomonas sp. HZM TaxID=1454010 RepID=UPI0004937E66|nr:hypothetical protein [Cellulomonas sp. HZM]